VTDLLSCTKSTYGWMWGRAERNGIAVVESQASMHGQPLQLSPALGWDLLQPPHSPEWVPWHSTTWRENSICWQIEWNSKVKVTNYAQVLTYETRTVSIWHFPLKTTFGKCLKIKTLLSMRIKTWYPSIGGGRGTGLQIRRRKEDKIMEIVLFFSFI